MSYRPVPETFRLTPVNGLKGSINSTFKPERIGLEIRPLFDLLANVLTETKYGLLKKNVFSLVNIYNPVTKHSVGYLAAPPASVITPFSGLAFTFALVPRPLKTTPKEVHSNTIVDGTRFWGKELQSSLDYLTINISRDNLKKFKGDYPYVDDIHYLYNVIGIMTKNFVLNNMTIFDNSPVEILNTRYFGQTLNHIFKNVGRNYWKFNKNVWLQCSNVLSPSDFDDHFYLYFALYLYDQVGDSIHSRLKKKIFKTGEMESYHSFLMDGVRAFVRSVKSGAAIEHEKSLTAVASLIMVLVDGEGLSSANEDLEVERLIENIRKSFESEPERRIEFNSKFSDISGIAKALINLDDSHIFVSFWS